MGTYFFPQNWLYFAKFFKRFSRYCGKSVISTYLQILIVEVDADADADADISIGSETMIEKLLNKLNPRYSQLSINNFTILV